MYLRFYKTNKNGRVLGKFYEIHQKKEKVYIHYGSEPNGPMSLPRGRFEEYIFNNIDNARIFKEKKVDEKLNKGYELEKINGTASKQSQIFKWMLKHGKPIVKNKKGGSKLNTCCKSNNKTKKCVRKDGKIFSLPRRFTKKRCMKGCVKGFTMKSSCAPYKYC